jgi:hypothetical protein
MRKQQPSNDKLEENYIQKKEYNQAITCLAALCSLSDIDEKYKKAQIALFRAYRGDRKWQKAQNWL